MERCWCLLQMEPMQRDRRWSGMQSTVCLSTKISIAVCSVQFIKFKDPSFFPVSKGLPPWKWPRKWWSLQMTLQYRLLNVKYGKAGMLWGGYHSGVQWRFWYHFCKFLWLRNLYWVPIQVSGTGESSSMSIHDNSLRKTRFERGERSFKSLWTYFAGRYVEVAWCVSWELFQSYIMSVVDRDWDYVEQLRKNNVESKQTHSPDGPSAFQSLHIPAIIVLQKIHQEFLQTKLLVCMSILLVLLVVANVPT